MKSNKTILMGLIILMFVFLTIGTVSTITADFLHGDGSNITGQECTNSTKINVKCFGAVGDGVTDDSAAIQVAVNYLGNGSKELVFPQGTYILQTTVYFNNTAGNIIRGTGTGSSGGSTSIGKTKIQWGNWAVSSPMFWFGDGASDTTVQDLWFVNGTIAIRFMNTSTGNKPKYERITNNVFDNQSVASVWVGYPIGNNADGDYDGFWFDHNKYTDTQGGTQYRGAVVLSACANGYRATFDKESWTNGNISVLGINWKVVSIRDSFFANMTRNGHAADPGAGLTNNYSIEMQRTTGCSGGNLKLDNILSEQGRLVDTTSYGVSWGNYIADTALALNDITFNLPTTYSTSNVTAVRHRYAIFATNVVSTQNININSTQMNLTTIQPEPSTITKVHFNPTDDTGAVVGAVNKLNPGD